MLYVAASIPQLVNATGGKPLFFFFLDWPDISLENRHVGVALCKAGIVEGMVCVNTGGRS